MSNEKYNAAAAGLTLAAIDGAQMMIESLRKDREYVITLLAAAQQEIASLKVRVWQCGAGAGCCAQAARIAELEAQIEAVGAGGVGPLVRRAAAGALTNEGTIAAQSQQSQHEHWATPTTVLQRTGDALQLLCAGQRPLDAIITGWLDNSSEELQAFCCQYGPSWCQGIAVIDAAMLMVDQPTEIVTPESSADHEHRAAPQPAPAAPFDNAAFELWWADHAPNSGREEAWAEWCALWPSQPAAQAQEGESGWLRSEALLYRLTDDRRQENFDEIQVTMANGSRDIHQRSAQAERLQVMLTAPQPPAQALDALKQVCAIAVSAAKTNSRDIADWREDMDRIAAIAAQQGDKT